jgi:hypothetical protein
MAVIVDSHPGEPSPIGGAARGGDLEVLRDLAFHLAGCVAAWAAFGTTPDGEYHANGAAGTPRLVDIG